jgi:DNA-binding CsgD family transcriptional regulator
MEPSLIELRKIFKNFNCEFVSKQSLDRHIEYVSLFARETDFAIAIFDNRTVSPVYISPCYRNFFGDQADEIHPNDFNEVMNVSVIVLNYLIDNDLNMADFRLIRKYRAKVKDEYLVVVEQTRAIEFDLRGIPWLSLSIIDVSPDQHLTGAVEYKLINYVTGEVVLAHENGISANNQLLSLREVEILRLIGDGFASKEIADKLQITLNTVNTHRQHILEKLNVRTSLDAVRYALEMALI